VALAIAAFTPWAYFLGGKFHVLPGWSGKGTLHARSGDFTLYVNLEPAGPGRRTGPRVTGTAVLLSPAGEKHSLKISGDFPVKFYGTGTNGRRMVLSFHRRLGLVNNDGRPRFDLDGRWQGANLVMSDGGSLSRAFLPDGHAWRGKGSSPTAGAPLRVTLAPCGLLDSFRALWGWGRP